MALLEQRPEGLYCPAGNFHVDPWRPVERAVITHAHADHARWGSARYLVCERGLAVFRTRLGAGAAIEAMPYGARRNVNGVSISFHPAGHILGSAQVRIEYRGEVCVASGDYKTVADGTCTPFEPVQCHTFLTESTFALPIYRWRPEAEVIEQVHAWWRDNQNHGRTSLLLCYALGKAQRVLHGLDEGIGPIFTHGATERLVQDYRSAGVRMPETRSVMRVDKKFDWSRALVVAPPSANGTPWMRRFGAVSTAFVSGWMQLRGARRRSNVDRGFVLSDHADWPGLLDAIAATGAEEILVTHGYTAALSRWLNEHGYRAGVLQTEYEGEALAMEAADNIATGPDTNPEHASDGAMTSAPAPPPGPGAP